MSELEEAGFLLGIQNQNEVEEQVMKQAQILMSKKLLENDEKRRLKCINLITKLESKLDKLKEKLEKAGSNSIDSIQEQISKTVDSLNDAKTDLKEIQNRIDGIQNDEIEEHSNEEMDTGKVTPFDKFKVVHNDQESDSESLTIDSEPSSSDEISNLDDGSEQHYQIRFKKWALDRRIARMKLKFRKDYDRNLVNETNLQDEIHLPGKKKDIIFENSTFRVPGDIYSNLFEYQKTSLRWFLELHNMEVGGILGDEMGYI